MEFQSITTTEQLREIFPLMRQLREHLDLENFIDLFQRAQEESGYTLIAHYENDQPVGLMGFRALTDFVHGRHLYIDDLVISESCRSKGLGTKLLAQAKKIAAENGCKRLRLCTGVQNTRGKNFYERNDWELKAVVYKASCQP